MKYQDRFQDSKDVFKYDQDEYGNNSYATLIWEIEKKYLEEEIKDLPKENYLDFACGTGRVIEQLEKKFQYSLGIDISQAMISLAQTRVKSKLQVLDISKESINQKFDLITAFRFFLNLDKELRGNYIKMLRQYLKKGGIMIITIQRNKNFYNMIMYWFYKYLRGKALNQMSHRDVKTLFETNGMRMVNYKGIGIVPKFLYRLGGFKHVFYWVDKVFAESKMFNKQTNIMIYTFVNNE